MEYHKLNEVAEALKEGLEAKKEEGSIQEYEVNVVPDDFKIELIVLPTIGMQKIRIELSAGSEFQKE